MGHTSTQISVNGNLAIPQHKPDIKSILRVTTTPVIDTTVTMQKKIMFVGHVRICVEYVASTHNGTQPIYFAAFKIPFNGLFCHRYARANLKACLKTKILFQHYDIIDPRTIKKDITLKLCLHKFIRIKKYVPAHCSEAGNIGEHVCSSEPQICCNKPLYPVCKEKPYSPAGKGKKHHGGYKKKPLYSAYMEEPPHHLICKHKPYPAGSKGKAHYIGCKNKPQHYVCKEGPPYNSISKDEIYQVGANNKLHTSMDNEVIQYGEFYLPQSIQRVYDRESGSTIE